MPVFSQKRDTFHRILKNDADRERVGIEIEIEEDTIASDDFDEHTQTNYNAAQT